VNVAFEMSFSRIIKAEGKTYSNNPMDLGGPTKYGITLAALCGMRNKVQTAKDIEALTENEARNFYFETYWSPLMLSGVVNFLITVLIMDQAVNRGRGAVVKQVQRILVEMKLLSIADGIMGQQTIDALNKVEFKRFGLAFYRSSQESYIRICQANPSQVVFLLGWIRRTHLILDDVIGGDNAVCN
jgi:lysozyme family protein